MKGIYNFILFFSCLSFNLSGQTYEQAGSYTEPIEPGRFSNFVVNGNYMYAVLWTGGAFNNEGYLMTYDISSGTLDNTVNALEISFGTLQVNMTIYRDHMYMINSSGIHIFNLSNPAQPSFVSTIEEFTVDGDTESISLGTMVPSGDYLFCTYGAPSNGILVVLDISNPTSPIVVDGIPSNLFNSNTLNGFQIIDESLAYLAANGDIREVNVSNPLDIVIAANNSAGSIEIDGSVKRMLYVENKYLIGILEDNITDVFAFSVDVATNQVLSIVEVPGIFSSNPLVEYDPDAKKILIPATGKTYVVDASDMSSLSFSDESIDDTELGIVYSQGTLIINSTTNSEIKFFSSGAAPSEDVEAAFTVEMTAVTVDQNVQFTDTSTGNPTSWSWTFENGTPETSTEQNPVVIYSEPGTYDVTLTVENATSSDEEVKVDFITVEEEVSEGCTGQIVLTAESGTVNDGSGDSDYQNDLSCEWLISLEETNRTITISFTELDTEDGIDFVTVYDGGTKESIIGQYSGNQLPDERTSTGHEVLIEFVTDGSIVGQGWELNYTANIPTCSGRTEITDLEGIISDGSGDKDYGNGLLCEWLISNENPEATITVSFSSFDVSSDDLFAIIDGDQLEDGALLIESGSDLPESVTSSGNQLLVYFETNLANTASGWELNYAINTPSTEMTCSGRIEIIDSSGTISDGSGAENYSDNLNCEWLIAIDDPNAIITMDFTEFETEADFDFLAVFDGNTSSDASLGRFSGNANPGQLVSSGNEVLIVFTSDESNTAAGWELDYSSEVPVTGINDRLTELIVVYPVPTEGDVTIKSDLYIGQRLNFELIDIMGKRLISGSSKVSNIFQLDMSTLLEGIYFLNLSFDDKRVVKRIVKID